MSPVMLRIRLPKAQPHSDADLVHAVNDDMPEWKAPTALQLAVDVVGILGFLAFLVWAVAVGGQ